MIEGNQINLRLFREKDLDEYLKLYNSLKNRGDYYHWNLEPESSLRKKFQEHGFWNEQHGRFLIVSKDDKLLGYINFFKEVPYFSSYEIGYRLFDIDGRRKGVMTESVKLLADYLFKLKQINRLVIRTHPKNIASQKVALKSGFTEEGKARGAILWENEWVDICQFSLTRMDFYSN